MCDTCVLKEYHSTIRTTGLQCGAGRAVLSHGLQRSAMQCAVWCGVVPPWWGVQCRSGPPNPWCETFLGEGGREEFFEFPIKF